MTQAFAGLNLRMSMTNGVSLFNIFIFAITGEKLFLVIILFTLGVFIRIRPTTRRVQRLLAERQDRSDSDK
jgi:hypothetical protein